MKNCGIGDVSNVKFKINEGLDSPTSEADEGGEKMGRAGFKKAIGRNGESYCSEQKDINFLN